MPNHTESIVNVLHLLQRSAAQVGYNTYPTVTVKLQCLNESESFHLIYIYSSHESLTIPGLFPFQHLFNPRIVHDRTINKVGQPLLRTFPAQIRLFPPTLNSISRPLAQSEVQLGLDHSHQSLVPHLWSLVFLTFATPACLPVLAFLYFRHSASLHSVHSVSRRHLFKKCTTHLFNLDSSTLNPICFLIYSFTSTVSYQDTDN
jgi:hypothetical protein